MLSKDKNKKIEERSIVSSESILSALKLMDTIKVKMLFVFENEQFVSILTIGDIQRAIVNNIALETAIAQIVDRNKKFAHEGESMDNIREKMLRLRAECMPVVDNQGELVDVIFWRDLFEKEETDFRPKIDLPVIIMAGGKGTRLKPITNVIPKPLVPIGEKTILEVIMDQFESIGCQKFYMSVNYKSDMLRFYLEKLEHKYDIDFFVEEKPLGTIGSVALLKGKIDTSFFVSNCDIVIDQDMRDVYEYHCKNNNDLTIVTAVKNFQIPYGVIETGENGLMTSLKEKPELTYMINTGVYILNPGCIDVIPQGEFFHITQLMEKIKAHGGRVGCFPVSEHAWKDMGEWSEYLKMINVI